MSTPEGRTKRLTQQSGPGAGKARIKHKSRCGQRITTRQQSARCGISLLRTVRGDGLLVQVPSLHGTAVRAELVTGLRYHHRPGSVLGADQTETSRPGRMDRAGLLSGRSRVVSHGSETLGAGAGKRADRCPLKTFGAFQYLAGLRVSAISNRLQARAYTGASSMARLISGDRRDAKLENAAKVVESVLGP